MSGFKTKAFATEAARVLKKRMKSKGWKMRVWENIGWHFSLQNGPLCIHGDDRDGYFCLLGDGVSGVGLWSGARSASFKDPNKAVEDEVKHARQVWDAYAKKHAEIVSAAEAILAK